MNIEQEYGGKSTSNTFKPKAKSIRQSHGIEEENMFLTKSKHDHQVKMKKVKSPARNKNEAGNKRKSVSRDRYF